MNGSHYTIIFPPVALPAEDPDSDLGMIEDVDQKELDEIAELRRVVEEIVSPELMSYTTT